MVAQKISADEFVEYATFLFGGEWRSVLPAKLGVPRKTLVMSLASGEQIQENMTLSILQLLEQKLEEMDQEQAMLKKRIRALRKESNATQAPLVQNWDHLQHAC